MTTIVLERKVLNQCRLNFPIMLRILIICFHENDRSGIVYCIVSKHNIFHVTTTSVGRFQMQGWAPSTTIFFAMTRLANTHQIVLDANIPYSSTALTAQGNSHANAKDIPPDRNVDRFVCTIVELLNLVAVQWRGLATDSSLDCNVIITTGNIVVFDDYVSGTIGVDPIAIERIHMRSNFHVMDVNIRAKNGMKTPEGRIFQRDTGYFHVLTSH
mmetsp:Transcript_34430/g.81163  ORF Transcript_34430/g.81163 Transcript_34430/m.81163 type:complete len:214 (+) Transcript_34430:3288-3929(+)